MTPTMIQNNPVFILSFTVDNLLCLCLVTAKCNCCFQQTNKPVFVFQPLRARRCLRTQFRDKFLPFCCSETLLSVTADCFIYKNFNRKDEAVPIYEHKIKYTQIHQGYHVQTFIIINTRDESDDKWKCEMTMKFNFTPNYHTKQHSDNTLTRPNIPKFYRSPIYCRHSVLTVNAAPPPTPTM